MSSVLSLEEGIQWQLALISMAIQNVKKLNVHTYKLPVTNIQAFIVGSAHSGSILTT